jgi:hypothetical protein
MTSYIGASPETTIARVRYLYTAVTAQDTFTTATDGQVLSYESTDNVDVFVNGVLLVPTTDYAAETGSSIVLVEAADADDKVEVLTYEPFRTASYLPTAGGIITGDLTVDTDTLHVDSTNNRVGIGTLSPAYNMHIKGSGSAFRLGLESDGLIVGQAFITDNSGSPLYASISSGLGNLTFAADSGNSYASSFMDFQIDGSEKMRIESSGNLQHLSKPAYFSRAWVNFNGSGTVSIRGSGNVSSITDLGTGNYLVNLSTAMSNTNYSVVASGRLSTNSSGRDYITTEVKTTSSASIKDLAGNGVFYDYVYNNVIIIG